MRVSAKAEYACIAMLELAANYQDPRPIHLKTIAAAHGIPPRFLIHILIQLKAAGMVLSVRGAAGGYQLSRPPAEISLADIIDTIDHAPARQSPVTSSRSAAVKAVRTLWQEIDAEERRMLEELTLAELLRRAEDSGALSYQI
jgi:Rrf2 family cysteine metabolism transcriptional repressor